MSIVEPTQANIYLTREQLLHGERDESISASCHQRQFLRMYVLRVYAYSDSTVKNRRILYRQTQSRELIEGH